MEKILAMVLLSVLLLSVPSALAAGMHEGVSANVDLTASLSTDHSVVNYNISGSFENETNATLSLNVNLDASSKTEADLQASLTLTYNNPSLPEATLDYTSDYNIQGHNYQKSSQGSLYINLTSLSTGGFGSSMHLAQAPGYTYTTTSMPVPTPPGNYTNPISGITAVYVNFNSNANGYYNGSYGEITSNIQAHFNIVNGALIIGMPGNATGNFIDNAHTIINGSNATLHYKEIIAFNSGNPQVDSGLAATIYSYLSMVANKTAGNGYMNATNNGTAVIIEGVTYGTVSNLVLPNLPLPGFGQGTAPGLPGPGMGMGSSMMSFNFTGSNITGVPLFYENATATLHEEVHLTSNNGQLQVSAQANGHVSGINPDALTFFPTKILVTANVNNKDYTAKVHVEGTGDPTTAFEIAKALALITYHAIKCPGSNVNVNMTSDGSVHFYNVKTDQDLGTSLQLNCENLGTIKDIEALPPNTTVKHVGHGTLVLSFSGAKHGKVSFATVSSAKVVVVNGKSVVIETGKLLLTQKKEFVVNAGGNLVVHVAVHKNSELDKNLTIKALDKTEADGKAKAYGYTAAGAGVEITGIAKGSATINLPAEKTSGIAILEISHNGKVNLITNYKVEANGTVTFNATSFSTFIVVSSGAASPPVSTTTTTQTPGGGGATQPGKTTSTTQPGTTTSPSGTSPGTTGGETSPAGTTQAKGKGTSTATIAAAVIIIIVIIAAAVYALRK